MAATRTLGIALGIGLLATVTPAQTQVNKEQVTKDDAEERLDTAIGVFRMAVATETKLMTWYEVDRHHPDAVALTSELCDNMPTVQRTFQDVKALGSELAARDPDSDLAAKTEDTLALMKEWNSKTTQLTAMGFSCPGTAEAPSAKTPTNAAAKADDSEALEIVRELGLGQQYRAMSKKSQAARDVADQFCSAVKSDGYQGSDPWKSYVSGHHQTPLGILVEVADLANKTCRSGKAGFNLTSTEPTAAQAQAQPDTMADAVAANSEAVKASPVAAATLATAGHTETPQSWGRSKWENPLYGKTYDQFILNGRYLTPPSIVGPEAPRLVVHCSSGKFASGEFMLGAIAQHSGTKSLKGAWQSQVDMRLDERKKTEDFWEYSNDGKTLFFDRDQLDQLLTGKLLGHPSKDEPTSRVILGVTEALGNGVIVQFDMPADQSEIIEACGLEWGRAKRK